MNELLRIFKRTFNLFGYDLKKAGKLILRPLSNWPDSSLKTVFDTFDRDQASSAADLDTLVVFVRTCLRANRNVDTTPRFTGATTAETIYRCLRSTIRAINDAHRQANGRTLKVIVLDDHSDVPYLEKIKELCQEIQCPWTLQTTRTIGQGPSLVEQFEMAKSLNALCYFCEDDYLHDPSAISELWNFYRRIANQTGSPLVLAPQECEFLYQAHYPSYILAGETRHWRTMNHATHVLFTHSEVVKTYWHYFENTKYVGDRKNRHLGAESKTTNLLFQHIPGFCPVPAVAGHAQFEFTLPPCFDWQKIWEANGPSE